MVVCLPIRRLNAEASFCQAIPAMGFSLGLSLASVIQESFRKSLKIDVVSNQSL
jgi:hypothetical protein